MQQIDKNKKPHINTVFNVIWLHVMVTVDRNEEVFKLVWLVSRTRKKRVFDEQIKTLNKFLSGYLTVEFSLDILLVLEP